ncbi:MAG: hypothetical protein HPY60_10735 [Candidatus Methanofastidiosum sp.]|nr:hypothetical protein [Methanofastidiosum sp.]
MKKTTLLLILLTFILKVNAQFDFKNEEKYISKYEHFHPEIIKLVDKGEFQFELRIWINSMYKSPDLLRITLQNDTLWIAEKVTSQLVDLFENENYKVNYSKVNLPKDWIEVWDNLVRLQILELPDMEDIQMNWKGEMYVSGKDTTYAIKIISDDVEYYFELFSGEKKRHFSYDCPNSYREFYQNVKELRLIVKILEIIFKELDYDYKVC